MKRSETEMFVDRRGRAPTQTSVLNEAWERTGLGPFAALRHPHCLTQFGILEKMGLSKEFPLC